jgi:E3 ubiquitin-protein ligase EDD1
MYSDLDVFTLSERASSAAGPSSSGSGSSNRCKDDVNPDAPLPPPGEDTAPLFYSPGKCGFYSPRQGRATPERINAFRNVGRYAHAFAFELILSLFHVTA